jgi:Kef-type K+ transport system membrane component KefB
VGARLDVFTAAPHDDVLKLLIQFGVLLAVARGLGEAASRAGQPRVLGEILAGIILGPSVLSGLFGTVERWMIPETATQGYLLEAIALIGAMLLMLITGLEMDLGLVRRHAATALGVSFGGIAFTFSTGFILGQLIPDSLLAQPDRRLVFALFMATAMSISAIPVIAKVLMDLNLMRRDIGQTIVAAGMSDDTIGWIILSIVIGMASGQATTWSSVAADIGGVAAFMVVSFTVGRWVAVRAVDFVQEKLRTEDRMLTLTVVLALGWAAVAQALHLEAVLGAFVCGIVLGQIPHLPVGVHHRLESMALAVFTPVFFGVAGLKVDIGRIASDSTLVLVAVAVIAVATVGKMAGTYAGARIIGRKDHWTALSFGAGLNARGAMEIIIATIGLSVGVLTQDMFSIIVLMAMATSLMAPTALRFTLARVVPEDEELARLRREEVTAASVVSAFRNVLYPVRPGNGVTAPDRDLAIQASVLSQKFVPRARSKS